MVGQIRILVVEDSEVDFSFLKQLLSRTGCVSISHAQHAGEAMELLADLKADLSEKETPTAVVLLDLHLPQGDGLSILHYIKNEPTLAHLRVHVVTSDSDSRAKRRALSSGADGYFLKPLTLAQLSWILERSMHSSVQRHPTKD